MIPQPLPEYQPECAALDATEAFVREYVAFANSNQATAVSLFVFHAHLIDVAETTPRLSVRSSDPQCGKTRLLEVIHELVPAPLPVANITPAALFRVIDDGPVTLLVDEVDTIFAPKSNYEEIRALINAGYRRGAQVARVVGDGKSMRVARFNVFAPVVLAGIGNLPDTIADRSIPIVLRRRAKTEHVAKFRRRAVLPVAERLREEIVSWAEQHRDDLTGYVPEVPDVLPDRVGDIWEPLLAIADRAGGAWPERARAAALALSAVTDTVSSDGIRLLADVREVFGEHPGPLSSIALVDRLRSREESPWADWFDARVLAWKLKPYDIKPRTVRVGDDVFKGYRPGDFHDAWARYLPTPPENVGYTVTSVTTGSRPGLGCNRETDVTANSEGDLTPAVLEEIAEITRGDCVGRRLPGFGGGVMRLEWEPIIDRVAVIVEEYDTSVSLRQLFYRLVSEGLIPNTTAAYKTLSSKTAVARREGWFPASLDRGRTIHRYKSFASPGDAQDYLRAVYRRDRTEGQEYAVYLAVEKAGLVARVAGVVWRPGRADPRVGRVQLPNVHRRRRR